MIMKHNGLHDDQCAMKNGDEAREALDVFQRLNPASIGQTE